MNDWYSGQLTPEQIQQIMAMGHSGTTSVGGQNYGLAGVTGGGQDGGFTPQQILGYQPGAMGKGATRSQFGLDGNYMGMGRNESPGIKDALPAVLAALGMGAFLPGGFGADFFGAGGAGQAGGEGLATEGGGAGLDTAATFNPAMDSQLASSQLGLTAGDTAAGGVPSVTVNGAAGTAGALTGGGAGGLLSGAGSLLGPAATLLGGLAGGKGQKTTETTSHDLPPEMKGYVYGQGGLLPGAMGLFQQQTAPGAMPGYQQMQNAGMGLLQQPMAGNGFAQFQQRPRFGG